MELIATSKSIRQMAKKITGGNDLYQDLIQHSLEILYNKGEEAVLLLGQKIEGYFVVIMYHEWNNKNNRFNKLYRHLEGDLEYKSLEAEETPEPTIKGYRRDIELCEKYFTSVCPDRLKLAKELERMKEEDRQTNPKGYPFRTALLELSFKHTSLRKLAKATGIELHQVYNLVKEIQEQIKKNIEDTSKL